MEIVAVRDIEKEVRGTQRTHLRRNHGMFLKSILYFYSVDMLETPA